MGARGAPPAIVCRGITSWNWPRPLWNASGAARRNAAGSARAFTALAPCRTRRLAGRAMSTASGAPNAISSGSSSASAPSPAAPRRIGFSIPRTPGRAVPGKADGLRAPARTVLGESSPSMMGARTAPPKRSRSSAARKAKRPVAVTGLKSPSGSNSRPPPGSDGLVRLPMSSPPERAEGGTRKRNGLPIELTAPAMSPKMLNRPPPDGCRGGGVRRDATVCSRSMRRKRFLFARMSSTTSSGRKLTPPDPTVRARCRRGRTVPARTPGRAPGCRSGTDGPRRSGPAGPAAAG